MKTEADVGRSGWLGSNSDEAGSGWESPGKTTERDSWGSPMSSPKSSERRKDEQDSESEFGWHYQEPTPRDEIVPDAWIDEELDYIDDYDDGDFSDRVSTQRIDLSEEAPLNPLRGFLVVVIALVVLGLVCFQAGKTSNDTNPEEASTNEVLQSAKIWLESARESADQQRYKDATLQYKRALEFFVAAKVPRERIIRTRVEYSDTLIELGDYLSAHEQIYQVSDEISDGDQRLAWVEEELVHEAILQLEQARQLLGSDPQESVRFSEDALEVFLIFNASNSQVAKAYDVLARAYLNLDQVTAAAESVKDALRWESSPERLALFAELFPSAPPPQAKPKRARRKKVQASVGEQKGIPSGTRARPRRPSRPREPVVVVAEPKPKPPEHQPNYEKFRQKKQQRLGHNPLTDN